MDSSEGTPDSSVNGVDHPTNGIGEGPSSDPVKGPPTTTTAVEGKVVKQELPPTDDPELDALLDDALKDFDKPFQYLQKKPSKTSATTASTSSSTSNNSAELMMDSVWAEEFIKQATTQFEQKMRECLHSTLKGGSKKQQKLLEDNMSKIVDAASTAALKTTTDPEALSSQMNEAIRNTAKKAMGIPPVPPMPPNLNAAGLPDEAEFARMMGGLGMGMDDENFDDSDMNEILPFMTNMMQKLLSKELLQPVLTDIVTKYPDWLSANREKLSSKDYDKYSQQYDFMKQICEEYASERDSDSPDMKKKRFDKISDLMLKVQYAGPPPQELIGEVEGGNPLPVLDPTAGDQCSVM